MDDESLFGVPPHPSVRRLVIQPEFDNRNQQTGEFAIEIDFAVEHEEERPDSYVVVDLGREVFDLFLGLLTFLSGYPVYVVNPPGFTHNIPGTDRFRFIAVQPKQAVLEPPVPLLNTAFFLGNLDTGVGKVLSWFRRGLEEKDRVTGMPALFASLEVLANQFECENTLARICPECGYTEQIRPGMKQNVRSLLVNVIEYTDKQFDSIWNARIELTHGTTHLSANRVRELNTVWPDLVVAIIKGVKRLLNSSSSEFPREVAPGSWFSDPVLDVEYTLPNEHPGGEPE